ncbi:MAG TPA: RodZ domain-containing protein [Steroidobacteraceae bacterium]|nr:RodZ domain-containing protein [Steroidobacteraceae bacterium]
MMAEAPGGELRGIGARLRAAREKRGLTLLQAAERLHLDAGIVQALEAENFTALGADVYVRGHLRRYAEAVGESPTQLQQLYADSRHVSPPDLTRIPRGPPEKSSSRLLLPAVLLVVGFAMAGLLWWLLTLPGEKAHALPAQPTPAAAAAAADAASGTEEAAFPEPAGTSAAPPNASPAGASTGTGPQARLDLSFSAASWVEISDVQGRRLLHGLIEAGSTRSLTGSAPLLVVLGNAPAVTLRVNGQAVLPGTLVRHDGSAHLMIDAAGRVSAAAPRLAHGD